MALGRVTQLGECQLCKLDVVGSIPSMSTLGRYISWLDSLSDKEKVARSIRARPTNKIYGNMAE